VYEISQAAGVVTAKVSPSVQLGQRVLLELIPQADPTSANLFDFGAAQAVTDTVAFPVSGLPAGQYLARVRVDGAESLFELDSTGAPVAPVITL
jgi:hypothetical protein